MRWLSTPFRTVRKHLRAYLLLNALAYGLLVIGMGAALLFPELNADRLAAQDASGDTDLVSSLLARPWLFALTILAVNLSRIVLAAILVPSLIVPFAGIAVFGYFAVTTGMTLAPVDETTALVLIPHSLTVVLEFQAYVLLLLGAYLLGRSWLWPGSVEAGAGVTRRREGYVQGLRHIGRLALPALALLVIGALYEAFSLRYLVPLLLA